MASTTLYLIRHGELVNSSDGIINGQDDIPLSDNGLLQMLRWTEVLRKNEVKRIYSSDLSRCSVPAKMLADSLGVPVSNHAEIREINAGDWQGRAYSDVIKNERELFALRMKHPVTVPFPGGESLEKLALRVHSFLVGVVEENPDSAVAVVAHAGVLRSALLRFLDMPFDAYFKISCDFSSMTILRFFDDGNCIVDGVNLVPDMYC